MSSCRCQAEPGQAGGRTVRPPVRNSRGAHRQGAERAVTGPVGDHVRRPSLTGSEVDKRRATAFLRTAVKKRPVPCGTRRGFFGLGARGECTCVVWSADRGSQGCPTLAPYRPWPARTPRPERSGCRTTPGPADGARDIRQRRREGWFGLLAQAAVDASQARDLIAAGALSASRGGRAEDWEGLCAWFDARTGRAARFSLRLVRALPGMHANLRRLHSSAGTASTRSRALALARAVLTPEIGAQIFQAALGDHSWRKLYGQADADDLGRNPSWRGGPQVPVPTLLRTAGRSGPRGRGAAPRDDTKAKVQVAAARARCQAGHQRALAAVLAALPGRQLDKAAARAALAALMAAARAAATGPRRTGTSGGLACTLVHTGSGTGILNAPAWRVFLPGRIPLFHRPGQRPSAAALAASSHRHRHRHRRGPGRIRHHPRGVRRRRARRRPPRGVRPRMDRARRRRHLYRPHRRTLRQHPQAPRPAVHRPAGDREGRSRPGRRRRPTARGRPPQGPGRRPRRRDQRRLPLPRARHGLA